MNLGVCHLEDEEENNKKETGIADEENDDDENGQVEESNKAMNEQAHGKNQNRRWKLKEWRTL